MTITASDAPGPTLVERLGYGRDTRLLIFNCDDLGSSQGANAAIERGLNDGVATSASLMVPCPWARDAARRLAGRDIGVHLTLTAEYPGYRWRSLTGGASLHDGDGFLPATTEEALARATPEDVRRECRAQIEQAQAWGVDPTHLDSHMGVNQLAEPLFEIYLDLAVEYRLPLRMVSRRGDERLGFQSRRRAADQGVIFTDSFIATFPRTAGETLRERLPALNAGVTEIYAHPVEDGPELRAYDLKAPDTRASDAKTVVDPEIAALMAEFDIKAISFRPLRELQRAA
jgi:predicted glycoside hydrolase/deacetylase ChbG (UPF0249 family)